jgi:hypothetical protein
MITLLENEYPEQLYFFHEYLVNDREEQLKKLYSESLNTLKRQLISISLPEQKNVQPSRRGISNEQRYVLEQWLVENINNPYPTQIDRQQLVLKTRLTIKQIDNCKC